MQEPENTPESAISSANGDTTANTDDIRAQRIADYVNESLAKDDAFEANLGAINADLMLVAHRYRHVLGEVLQQPLETLAEMAEVMPGVDGFLRVTKQVDRFSQLVLKLKQVNNQVAP